MLLFVLCCASVLRAFGPGEVVVTLRDQSVVRGTLVLLGDLAEVTGDDSGAADRLAALPIRLEPGSRLLSRADLEKLLEKEMAGLKGVRIEGAPISRVTVGAGGPEAEPIAQLLKARLAAVTQWSEEEILVRRISGLDDLGLPAAGVEYRVAGHISPGAMRNPLVPFEALIDGKRVRTFWVKAEVRVVARVVKALNRIDYRSRLQAADLEEIVCEIEDPGLIYVRALAEATGAIAKRTLAPGDLIRKNWLEAGTMVRKGDTVRLVAVRDSVSLTVLARALQDGKLGEQIRVQNLDFNRPVTAQVTGEREVRVGN